MSLESDNDRQEREMARDKSECRALAWETFDRLSGKTTTNVHEIFSRAGQEPPRVSLVRMRGTGDEALGLCDAFQGTEQERDVA